MSEFDTITITNPTNEDFTQRYNGEPYTLASGETKSYVSHIAFHIAKHLSTKMIQDEVKKKMTKKQIENPNDAIHMKIAQLAIYDTHERRIALYKILKDVNHVIECIKRYPFKGFIGDMKLYEDFVNKAESKSAEASKPKEKEAEAVS